MAIGGISGIGQIGSIGTIGGASTKKKEQYQSVLPKKVVTPAQSINKTSFDVDTTGLDKLKKETTQYQSKQADNNYKQVANNNQNATLKASADKTAIESLTQKQNKSYIIRPENPDKEYSRLEKDEADNLRKMVDNTGLTGLSKDAAKQEAYKTFMEAKQARAFLNEREATRQKLLAGDIKGDKNEISMAYKTSTVADLIRKSALADGYKEVTDTSDDDILTNIIKQKPELVPSFQKYINGDIGEIELTKELGLDKIDTPTVEGDVLGKLKQFGTNVTAGALAGATSLPRFLATNLYKGVGWLAKEMGADEKTVNSWVDRLNQGISEEQLAKEMGADMENLGYKGTKFLTEGVQQFAGGTVSTKGLTSALGTRATKLGRISQGALVGGAVGAGETQAMSIMGEGKLASGKQTLLGAGMGALGGALTSKSISPAKSDLKNIIKETESKADKLAALRNTPTTKMINNAKENVNKLKTEVELLKKNGVSKSIIKSAEKEYDKAIKYFDTLKKGTIQDQRSGFINRISGGKNIVNPSSRTVDAVDTIVTEIPDFKTKPVALYKQIKDKVVDLSTEVGEGLSKVDVTKSIKKTNDLKTALSKVVIDAEDVLGKSSSKEIKKLIVKLDKSKTGNDVWTNLKELDALVGDKIKIGKNLSQKEETFRKFRRSARDLGNDYLDDIGEAIPDLAVKDKFKTMSNLLHANGQIEQKIATLTEKEIGAFKRLATSLQEAMKYGIGGAVAGKTINMVTGQ